MLICWYAYKGYGSEGPDRDRSYSTDSNATGYLRLHRCSKRIIHPINQQPATNEESIAANPDLVAQQHTQTSCSNDSINAKITTIPSDNYLSIPSCTIATSTSLDTLTECTLSGPSSPSNLSSVTLVGSTGSGGQDHRESKTVVADDTADTAKAFEYGAAPVEPLPERKPKACDRTADAPPAKETIITYSLPPTVTTTTHFGTGDTGVHVKTVTSTRNEPPVPPRRNRNPSIVKTVPDAIKLQPHEVNEQRRPSAGTMSIPHAALCQHRHSLQLNGGSESSKVGRVSPVLTRRRTI